MGLGSAPLHLFLLSPSSLYYLGINPTKSSLNPKISSQFHCLFSSRPRWDPFPDSSRGDRFEFEEEFGFGGGVRQKRRNWWSDDEDDDGDDDADEGDEFGFWEEPSAIDFVFKILGAFAWMIPAVAISALLGTGSNSLIMALVLPLGQTALSFAMDKLWARPSSSSDPRPRSRSRRRTKPEADAFAGSSTRYRKTKRGAQGSRTGTRTMNGSNQSWGSTNSGRSAKTSGRSVSKFGGWDELDEFNDTGTVPKVGQDQKTEGLVRERHLRTVKLSVRRKGETPLFFRLLIAVFPFLGSWTRFLF